jgi:hypothetical protein
MSIQIRLHNDSAYAPTVVCDGCREIISDAKDGNCQWFLDKDGKPEESIYFVHKECSQAFEVQSQRRPMSIGLEAFMAFLTHNLKLNSKDAERAASLSEGVWPPDGLG